MIERLNEKYMLRCLELAAKGLGYTGSNPLVGCVIVYNDRIIGEGYHREYGGPHAEVIAIESVSDSSQLKDSTLYVNLEPCCHFGKTPPCTIKIKESGIRQVVVGCSDPNAQVSGKGIEFLINNGISVESNFMEEECRYLNKRFFTYIKNNRPYIILKWAKSQDGYLDSRSFPDHQGQRTIITGKKSQILLHKWRSEEMAIMVGTHTANMDDPSLNVRLWKGNNPLRILLERQSVLNENLKIFHDEINTVVYSSLKRKNTYSVEYIYFDLDNFTLENILADIKRRGVISILIEGGTELINSFILQNLWDEARIFTGNLKLKRGLKAPFIDNPGNKYQIGEDSLEITFNNPF